MLIIPIMVPFAYGAKQIELTPTDDAYVLKDINDPVDKAGLRSLNTGDLEIMKIWYAWNVTSTGNEQIISMGYMKFNLKDINAEYVESAKLQLYAYVVTLTGASRAIDVHLVENGTWDERTLVYDNATVFNANASATTSISKAETFYTWDITELVKERAGSELSLVILFKTLYHNNEEQVVFHSKDVQDASKVPKLLIDYTGSLPSDVIDNNMIMYGSIAAAAAAGGVGFLFYNRHRSSTFTSNVNTKEKLFCFDCGKEISEEYNVCPYCGTRQR